MTSWAARVRLAGPGATVVFALPRVFSVLTLLTLAACSPVDAEQLADVVATSGDAASGEALYGRHCERCHGIAGDGEGAERGPVLAGLGLSDEDIAHTILAGPYVMPSFAEETVADLADLTAYVASLQ